MNRTTLIALKAYLAEHAPSWTVKKINLFDGTTTQLMTTTNVVNNALQMYTGSPRALLCMAKELLEPIE